MVRRATDARRDEHDFACRLVVSTAATGGRFGIVELTLTGGNTLPPHVHHAEDQVLVVLDGALHVTVGDHRSRVTSGKVVFCPRGVVHHVVVDDDVTHVLTLQFPGGLEPLYRARASGGLDPELLLAIAADHRVEILTPPLPAAKRPATAPTHDTEGTPS